MAGDQVEVNSSVDLYNRYVWRGIDIANTPSMQPSLSISYYGLELGAWGAYTLSNQSYDSDEIDFWLGYTKVFQSGASVTLLATDYYYPNAGIQFFNFNDYDAVNDAGTPDPGAHLIEVGISVTGPATFPISVSGYVNVYNELGNNTYFEASYPVSVSATDISLFCGVAGGSKENPGYYGTEEVSAINIGVTAVRNIDVSESFTLPISVSLIVNPKSEITHLLMGFSL